MSTRVPFHPRLAALVLGVAALAGLAACGGGEAGKKGEAVEAAVVGVARARPLSGGATIVATGAFRREREIDLSFRIPGVLRSIEPREGDLVAAGAIVAAIDPTGVEAQEASAQAQALQAAAGIGQAQEQARAAGSNVSAAMSGAAQARAGVAQAEAALAQARADLANVAREHERDAKLAARGFVAPARLEARQTRLDVARASVTAAESGVAAARAAVQSAQASVAQAQAGAGAAVAGVRAATGRAQGAQAGVRAAQFDRRWARLVAPSAGVVLTRTAEPGEVVAPGQPIVTLADETSPLILRTPVSDRDVVRIRVGDAARVRVAAANADFAGAVSRVAERADPRTGAFDVDIRMQGSPAVKTGFFGEARILATAGDLAPTDRTLVPAEAIIEADAGKASIFVLTADGKSVRRSQFGFAGFSGDDAILIGLPAGARVVTTGGGFVSDGAPVQAVETGPGGAR
jgi:RND family efflux transporter MFP subunit